MLSFRQAQVQDSGQLTELARKAKQYWGYSEEFMVGCADELSQSPEKILNPRFYFTVAELENQIVGFFCLEQLSKSEAEVEALFLLPEAIGRGYGRQCWQQLILVAKNKHFKTLKIASDPYALPFYLKMGATEVGKIPSGSIEGRFLPLMEYSLVPIS